MLSKKIVWKLNIIDVLLLAVIALSICALIYKATWGNDDEHRVYEVSYVCESVPVDILDGLCEGMECSDYASGSDLGVFKRVDYALLSDFDDEKNNKEDNKKNHDENDENDEKDEKDADITDAYAKRGSDYARAVIVTEAEGEKAEHGINIDGTVILKALKLDLIVGDTVLNVYVNEVN